MIFPNLGNININISKQSFADTKTSGARRQWASCGGLNGVEGSEGIEMSVR